MEKLNFEHAYVAIIAGGAGTRLFPYSNPERPKQFCALNDTGITFIQNVVDNFTKIGIRKSHVVVITTNENQTRLAKEQVLSKGVISQNIHQIPPGLDYGGAMIEATKFVKSLDDQAVIINTPSDQFIEIDDDYRNTISNAIVTASQGEPVVVGVKVNDLATVMGCGHAIYEEDDDICFPVERFVEKPNEKEATTIMRAGNSACSTGISVWRVDSFFNYIPEDKPIEMATNVLMEKFPSLKVAVGNFGWHDCGNFKALYEVSKKTPNHKNASFGGGEIERYDCLGSLFLCDDGYRLNAAGCRNVAVIVTTKESKPTIAITDLEQCSTVRKLAEDYAKNKDLLKKSISIEANNNHLAYSNMSEETITFFNYVNGYTVNIHRNSDGVIDVNVSGQKPA